MNLRKIVLIPALLTVALSSFISCGVDRWPEYAKFTALDTWIDSLMREDYLWYNDMPPMDELNLFAAPAEFLSKAKSGQDKNFSSVDTILENAIPSYGFDYALYRNMTNDTAYNALVTYIIPNSPASRAGLKRGEWIMEVNNTVITKKTEKQLLQGFDPVNLVIGTYQKVENEEGGTGTPGDGTEDEEANYNVVKDHDAEMGAAEVVTDNPVHRVEVLTTDKGQKVGYLMYNSFTAGTEHDNQKYNDELRAASQMFSNEGVDTYVIDFRYNKGGSIDCAQLLSTMFVSSSFLNSTMAFLEFNDKKSYRDKELTFDSEILQNGVNLNPKMVYVLTSSVTAGAPEMFMNCLNGKVSVMQIGGNTKGENVATEKFRNLAYHWAVNLVVCTLYNSEHESEYTGGFKPTYSVNETTDFLTFLPFGDPKEALLSVALGVIDGTYPPQTDTETTTKKIPVKTVTSPASRKFEGGLRIK